MKRLDLTKILKDAPRGTTLYSPAFGEVEFSGIDEEDKHYPIEVLTRLGDEEVFTKDGKFIDYPDTECVLFPSKENRDWDTFEVKEEHLEVIEFEQPTTWWFKQPQSIREADILMDKLSDLVPTSGFGYIYKPCQDIKEGQIVYNIGNSIKVINDVDHTFSTVIKMIGCELRIKK